MLALIELLLFFIIFQLLFLQIGLFIDIFGLIQDAVPDVLLDLVKFLNLMVLVEGKLFGNSSFSDFYNEILYFFGIAGRGIKLLNRVNGNTRVILEGAEFVFLFNTAFLVVDENIVGIVVIDI